ncbi:MAG: response regulator [Robiginitomaculum sp.]
MKNIVLIADDDASIVRVLALSLTRAGFKVQTTDNARTLLKWVQSGVGHVVLTDVHMGIDNIFDFLPQLKAANPNMPLIVMSANSTVMTALKSEDSGVFAYFPKPFDLKELTVAIKRSLDEDIKDEDIKVMPKKAKKAHRIVGKSAAMQPVFQALANYRSADIPVFIRGETGSGKSLIAQLVHDMGKRAARPLVYFKDYYDLDTLLSAVNNGDMLVERVDELSQPAQSFLLSVLEANMQIEPDKRFRVIVTSTNILAEVGGFRNDLNYRLVGGIINLPSLEQRGEDIVLLAHYFLNSKQKTDRRKLSTGAITVLKTHNWPGNVRQLEVLMDAVSLKYTDMIITRALLSNILNMHRGAQAKENYDIQEICRSFFRNHEDFKEQTVHWRAMAYIEKPLIEEALRITNGNNLKAAEILGIHRNTLRAKIRGLKINISK